MNGMLRKVFLAGLWVLFLWSIAAGAADQLDELTKFNFIVGTQTFNASYQFTDQTRLVETAEGIRKLGASVIKFGLMPNYEAMNGAKGGGNAVKKNPAIHSLMELTRDEPSHRHVLDMPFANYVIWMHTFSTGVDDWRNGLSAEARQREYHEVYELVAYLLKTYSGTGKTFYLGHWEGDGWLRGTIGRENDVRVTPAAVQGMIDWLTVRQQAVDDAKRDTPHHDAQVWHYTEVNHVAIARDEGRPALVNKVLPYVPVDFVSYSSWDTSNSPRVENIKSALDYIESKLTPKPGIKGKRVFIGEHGYAAGAPKSDGKREHTPEEQNKLSRMVMRAGLEWGCPFILYWEYYNNEIYPDGRQRGFWMIDDKNLKQPVYYTQEKILKEGRKYVAGVIARTGKPPTFDEYRQKALEILDEK
jgi:hypothetical protein